MQEKCITRLTIPPYNGGIFLPQGGTKIMPQVKVKCNWAQIPNSWLRDKNLSLKAKGLISVMQSLPDDWNFSVKGLASILKECTNTINAVLQELEEAGYLMREQIREDGKIVDTLYTLREFSYMKNSHLVKSAQYNKDIQIKEREKKIWKCFC